ncbi:hypothetical protein BURC_02289 [Burkholderiaceae bacterium]|nr:hypothetical protein BURC_02289 [Burkholderiaceae bacterium]
MHLLYGTRGYRTIITLLALQTAAFAGLLLVGATSAPAGMPWERLPQAVALWVAAGVTAAFMLWTWTTLSEASFCLHLLSWKDFLRYQLRPLLWLAPLALVASDLLGVLGVSGWPARAPLLVVGTLGLLACLLYLLQVVMISRQVARHGAVKSEVLGRLRQRYGPDAIQRLSDSLDYERDRSQANPFQMRRGLMLADLPSPAWHERSQFGWASNFELAAEEIRNEALAACTGQPLNPYSYPGAVQGSWNVFWLVRDGVVVPEAEKMCPATLRALRHVPGFPCVREAHYSVLQPHSRILPHCDESNTWITAHFGVQIPPHCGLRVGRETRQWKEGRFLFFDTTYQHEAWNDSDTPRVVLLFDFLHPQLSQPEREFVMLTNNAV